MKRLQHYFLQRALKTALPSKQALTSSDPKVTILTRDKSVVDTVKKFFSKVDFVLYEDMKRPKDETAYTWHVYKDDLDYRGVPKRTIPAPEQNHILLNLEPNDPLLTWYWYARSYDFKVDWCQVYEDADIQIGKSPDTPLLEKLHTLQKTLNVITK